MIDLKNTYIVAGNKELDKRYFAECEKQGIEIYGGERNAGGFSYIYVKNNSRVMGCDSGATIGRIQLTLADFEKEKPALMNEDSLRGRVSSIANQLHNMGCSMQDTENGDLLEALRDELWGMNDELSNESTAKPRTKIEYVNISEEDTCVWDLKEMLEREEVYHLTGRGEYLLCVRGVPMHMLICFDEGRVYRKVETEIKKEKRWVVYNPKGELLAEHSRKGFVYHESNQIIEITVEV